MRRFNDAKGNSHPPKTNPIVAQTDCFGPPLDVIPCNYHLPGMMPPMQEQTIRQAPPALTDALDASVHDLTAGNVSDAAATQRQARRMLEAFENAGATDGTHARTK
jgi:hypothetical protein